MGFGESIKTCIAKMTTFSGRASRSEFWWWQLFETLVAAPLLFVIFVIFAANGNTTAAIFFYVVSGIMLFLIHLSVMIRRLHDTTHSGAAYFIVLIPVLGLFILLYWMLCDSTPGDNQYGPNPKEVRANKRVQKKQSAQRVQSPRYSSGANSKKPSKPLVDYSGGSARNEREEPQPEQPVFEETRMMDDSADSVLSRMPKLVCDGASYLLSEGVNIVGRQSQNSQANVQIATDDRYMSRNHSRFTVDLSNGIKVTISNYENKNSTFVNDQELLHDKELTDGDEIKMGHTIVTFKL